MSIIVKADAGGAVTLSAELCRSAGVGPDAELLLKIQSGRMTLQAVPLPIWERIVALTADAPAEELDKPPTDGASQHDYYVYGTPKRPVCPKC